MKDNKGTFCKTEKEAAEEKVTYSASTVELCCLLEKLSPEKRESFIRRIERLLSDE